MKTPNPALQRSANSRLQRLLPPAELWRVSLYQERKMSIGKFSVWHENQTGIGMLLYDFAIGSDRLKTSHTKAINTYVIGYLMGGKGTVSAIGITSRTGSKQENLKLSKRRASSVANYLFSVGLDRNRVHNISGLGENLAALSLVADDTESELFRGVMLSVWLKSSPPPIQKKVIIETRCEVPGLVDKINNNEDFLVKGGEGKGDHRSLRRFIKGWEQQLLTTPLSKQTAQERRLTYFYNTQLFADWYLYGHCGAVKNTPIEVVVRHIPRFLSKKGRDTHGKDTGSFNPANLKYNGR